MCNYCSNSIPEIDVTLKGTRYEDVLCPNCLVANFVNDYLPVFRHPNSGFKDDITGRRGAFKLIDGGTTYTLSLDSMLRLINRSLTPNEWQILSDKYGSDQYLLHDDFYSEDGTALQPILDERGINQMLYSICFDIDQER